jgi:hypothetical protein
LFLRLIIRLRSCRFSLKLSKAARAIPSYKSNGFLASSSGGAAVSSTADFLPLRHPGSMSLMALQNKGLYRQQQRLQP